MPGSVSNARVPVVGGNPIVLPFVLCRAFVETRDWAVRENEYHDGTSQRQALVATSRRSWKLSSRLVPSVIATLRAFMLTYPTDAFYYYDPKEPATGQLEGSNYDPTGASVIGRYLVRLAGDITETVYIPRTEISVSLVEVA